MRSAVKVVASVGAALASVLVFASCGADSRRTRGPVERDSAGIRIVEHAGEAPVAWNVARAPSLSIGVADGDSMELLYRVSGALAVGADEIVIANGAAPFLRWFDRHGRFLRAVGRAGAGPGEFQGSEGGIANIAAFWPVGPDSMATWETGLMRMQVFGPSGSYVRAVTIQPPDWIGRSAFPHIVGRMGREGFVAYIWTIGAPRNVSGTWRDSMMYARWRGDGAFADTIALLPGMELHNSEFMGERAPGRVPFGKPIAGAADATGFYYGAGDAYEILAYDTSGRLRMILRRDTPPRPIGDVDVEAYVQEALREAPEDPQVRPAWERTLRAAPFPTSLPAYRRMRTDRQGNLWVQDYGLPGDQEATWNVFDAQGAWLATVRLPSDWQIQDIGNDYILVVTRSELDVEVVQLFALDRTGAPATRH
jgi:hypothetical protein